MKKILIIGSTGTLGSSLCKIIKDYKDYKILELSRKNKNHSIDITDHNKLINFLEISKPSIIINCSGLVDIQYCKRNPYEAWKIHVKSTINLINYLSLNKKKYIHISTDQFYDGKLKKNKESSGISFINEYATTKYFADLIASHYADSIIIRTNLVGFRGNKKNNFLESIISEIKKKKKLKLFNDYIVSSIDTINLSKIIIKLIEKDFKGIINIGCRNSFSKKEFILKLAKKINLTIYDYESISAKKLVTKRQLNCALDVSKIENFLNSKMPSLEDVLNSIANEYLTNEN